MKRLRAAVPALFLLAAVLFVALLIRRTPPPLRSDDEVRINPEQGNLLGEWMSLRPDGAAGCRFDGGEIKETFGVFRYACPAGRVEVELHHRDAVSAPARRTEQFALRAGGDAPAALLDALDQRLRAREPGYRWIEAGGPEPPFAAHLRRLAPLQLPVAWLLLAQAPLWIALACRRAFGLLAALPRPARLAVAGAVIAAAAARWLIAPLQLVMLYVGYQLTGQAIALQPIPRYGAGVPAFHHVLLQVFGADHAVILRAHAVLGVAMVPLVAALAHAVHRRARTTVAAAFLWALVPAFVSHDDSEAITVPILFFVTAGLLLVGEALEAESALLLTGAAALLGFAMIGRPEMPLYAGLAALAVAAALPGVRRRWALPHAALLAAALAVLIAPHLAHVYESARLLAAQGSLPMGHAVTAAGMNPVGVTNPRLYPVALVPLALLALAPLGARDPEGPRPWRSALLLGVAAADFAVTVIDLDLANILRVQVPGALFYALVAAAGIDRALVLLARTRLAPRAAAGALVGAIAVSAVPCLRASFQRTNEAEEEAFIRAARAALPRGDVQLVRLGYGDDDRSIPGTPVHLHFPDYLFSPPGGPRRVRDIVEWERDPTHPAAYFYLGMRCYTPPRSFDTGGDWLAPGVIGMRPECRRIVEAFGGETILARDAPNHGDPVRTGYYGTDVSKPHHLALIKLRPR